MTYIVKTYHKSGHTHLWAFTVSSHNIRGICEGVHRYSVASVDPIPCPEKKICDYLTNLYSTDLEVVSFDDILFVEINSKEGKNNDEA